MLRENLGKKLAREECTMAKVLKAKIWEGVHRLLALYHAYIGIN